MKIIKRCISLLLALTLIVTMLAGCSSLNLKNVDNILNKGEWLQFIGNYFGLQDTEDSKPYFTDVSADNELYSYAQACVNWNIIDKSETLNPKENITREYAFATVVRAIGSEMTNLSDSPSNKEAALYAYRNGIADSNSWIYMHEGVTEQEAVQIMEKAVAVTFARKYDERDNTVYNTKLKHQEDISKTIIDQIDNKVILNSASTDYKVGDVIAFGEDTETIYVKVTRVEQKDGKTVLHTETPEITDVFEKIDFSGNSFIDDPSQIICEDGVELVSFDGVEMVGNHQVPEVKELGRVNDDIGTVMSVYKKKRTSNASKSFVVKVSVGSKGPSIEVQPKVNSVLSFLNGAVGINGGKPDADTISKWTTEKDLPKKTQKSTNWAKVSDKYAKGWTLTGTLTIDDFTLSSEVVTEELMGATVGMNSMDITASSKTTFNLALKGYLTEDVKVATVVMPVIGPLGIKVAIKVHAEVNGELAYTYSVENKTNVKYSKKNGTKKTSSTKDSNSLSLQVTIKVGVEFSVAVSVGSFALLSLALDMSVSVSAKIGATWLNYSKEGLFIKGGDEALLEDRQDAFLLCLEVKAVLPVVTLKLSLFPDIKWLTLNLFNIKIADEKGGLIKSAVLKHHWELEGKSFAYKGETCTIDGLTEYKYENIDEAKTDENYDESTTLGHEHHEHTWLDKYVVEVPVGGEAEVNVMDMPFGYAIGDLEYSIDDVHIAYVSEVVPTENEKQACIKIIGEQEGTATISLMIGDEFTARVTVIVQD